MATDALSGDSSSEPIKMKTISISGLTASTKTNYNADKVDILHTTVLDEPMKRILYTSCTMSFTHNAPSMYSSSYIFFADSNNASYNSTVIPNYICGYSISRYHNNTSVTTTSTTKLDSIDVKTFSVGLVSIYGEQYSVTVSNISILAYIYYF